MRYLGVALVWLMTLAWPIVCQRMLTTDTAVLVLTTLIVWSSGGTLAGWMVGHK